VRVELTLPVFGLAAAALSASACTSMTAHARPVGALEARARIDRNREASRAPETSTRAYRALADRTLGTRCRMFPSDSEVYDVQARRCGAISAATKGVSRLLLEVAASDEFVSPVILGGRVRWLDPPDDACAP
jgi:hypothetical protein